jgi:hypothetical protein
MYRFIGKYLPEILALLVAAVVAQVGLYLAWTYEPVWLNRAGALIIITGVVLAASRFHEKVHGRALATIEANYNLLIDEMAKKFESPDGPQNGEDRERLRVIMMPAIRSAFAQSLELNARRIRMWEIWLVIIGTFLNGFGDYIISIAKRA